MKKFLRKRKHIQRVHAYIADAHWELINITISASQVGWTEETTAVVLNYANLIRKYERRLKLLKF